MLKQGIRTKSSYSGSTGATCTTVLDTGTRIEVTDSKFGRVDGYAPTSPVVTVSRGEFARLVASVKSGDYVSYSG